MIDKIPWIGFFLVTKVHGIFKKPNFTWAESQAKVTYSS